LKTACLAGVDEVSIQVAKPPAAWKGIAFVEKSGVGLERLAAPHTLRLKVVADPGLTLNTHTIRVSGASGRITLVLENVPSPENPKTSWLACYSALAALESLGSRVRYGA
jgi:aspartate dehydrogenase